MTGTLEEYIKVAAWYIRAGMGRGTLKSYNCAWVYFRSFCCALGTPHHPVSVPVICAYIVHCFTSRKLQPSTIKAAIAGFSSIFDVWTLQCRACWGIHRSGCCSTDCGRSGHKARIGDSPFPFLYCTN